MADNTCRTLSETRRDNILAQRALAACMSSTSPWACGVSLRPYTRGESQAVRSFGVDSLLREMRRGGVVDVGERVVTVGMRTTARQGLVIFSVHFSERTGHHASCTILPPSFGIAMSIHPHLTALRVP